MSSLTHIKENDHSWKEYHRKILRVGDKKCFAKEQCQLGGADSNRMVDRGGESAERTRTEKK